VLSVGIENLPVTWPDRLSTTAESTGHEAGLNEAVSSLAGPLRRRRR
jgi:hypothetical protein